MVFITWPSYGQWVTITCSLSSFVNDGGIVPEIAVWSISIVCSTPLKLSLDKRALEMVPDIFQFWSIERTWDIYAGYDHGCNHENHPVLPCVIIFSRVCYHAYDHL